MFLKNMFGFYDDWPKLEPRKKKKDIKHIYNLVILINCMYQQNDDSEMINNTTRPFK